MVDGNVEKVVGIEPVMASVEEAPVIDGGDGSVKQTLVLP